MPHKKYINRTERNVADTIDPALLAEVRAYLSMRYERRLNNKLGGRQPVNLKIIPSTTGTSEESANTYITFPEDQVKGAIGDIFLRSNGRLLLLGAPGAGKTTLVLQLALFLLEREGVSMPVVLNLATWTSKFETLDEWLSEILPAELAVSAPFAKKIRSNIPLILLLDGLDEVPEADRGTCIDALGEYGSNAQHQFLISSRIDEYSATKDAPVNAQIEVQQLTIEQVELALMATAHLQPESSRLLNALKTDPLLREAMENPFYLNTAQLLFSTGKNWSAFGFVASDVAGRQQEIKHFFIRDALQRKENYPSEKSERWLSFLASRMNQRNMVVFELRDLQYDWWKWSKLQSLAARVTHGLIYGCVGGLCGGLFYALLNGVFHILGFMTASRGLLIWGLMTDVLYGMSIGLGGGLGISLGSSGRFHFKSIHGLEGLIGGVIIGLIGVLSIKRIQLFHNDYLKRPLGKTVLQVRKKLFFGLVFGFIFGMVYSLVKITTSIGMGLIAGWSLHIGIYKTYLIIGIEAGIVAGLIIGLLAELNDKYDLRLDDGLVFGIAGGLTFGFLVKKIQIKTKDGITWSWINYKRNLKKTLIFSIFVGLVGMGYSYRVTGPVIGFLTGFSVIVIFGLGGLLYESTTILQINTPYQRFNASIKALHFSIIQHKLLCYQLTKQKMLPPDLVQFLNEMSLRHILEFDGDPTTGKGGGSWRFRHRILQEYFAERWVEPDRNV